MTLLPEEAAGESGERRGSDRPRRQTGRGVMGSPSGSRTPTGEARLNGEPLVLPPPNTLARRSHSTSSAQRK